MTLDETIKEFTDWAKDNRKEQNFWAAERDENDETNPLSYADCEGLARDAETRAEYHEQLAEWLTELRELRNSLGAVKLKDMKEAVGILQELNTENNQLTSQLAEAKRLLKLAVEDMKTLVRCDSVQDCLVCKYQLRDCDGFAFEWKHMEDVNNLINPIE